MGTRRDRRRTALTPLLPDEIRAGDEGDRHQRRRRPTDGDRHLPCRARQLRVGGSARRIGGNGRHLCGPDGFRHRTGRCDQGARSGDPWWTGKPVRGGGGGDYRSDCSRVWGSPSSLQSSKTSSRYSSSSSYCSSVQKDYSPGWEGSGGSPTWSPERCCSVVCRSSRSPS